MHLIKGYDNESRKLLSERITDVACATTGADPELVIVTIKEVDGDNYMRGRKIAILHHLQNILKILSENFFYMEKRNLDAASSFLSDDFVMTFPGGNSFTKLKELVEWSKTRYQKVSKTFDGFDTSLKNGSAVVTCFGTLNGTWLDGEIFPESVY